MKPFVLPAIFGLMLVPIASAQYSDPFDPWRTCTKYAPAAAKGNPMALHTCFLASYVRQNDPYLGGEDLEAVFNCMDQLLRSLGDKKFSEGLALERAEIQAAVGKFLLPKRLEKSPQTYQLIQKAPKIDFPLYQSSRDANKSPLLERFIRYEERHKSR